MNKIDLSEQQYYDPNLDGITHINVYSKGRTRLGRFLSNWEYYVIDVPNYGKFNTIEGLWGYLKYKDERFRLLAGESCKQLMNEYIRQNKKYEHVENFEQIILNAVKQKLNNIPTYVNPSFEENKLPYVHYYVMNDKSIYAKEGQFIIEYLNSLLTHKLKYNPFV